MFDRLIAKGFQVEFHSHSAAILGVDFPDAADQLEDVLCNPQFPLRKLLLVAVARQRERND